jgi:hypothetical protein
MGASEAGCPLIGLLGFCQEARWLRLVSGGFDNEIWFIQL